MFKYFKKILYKKKLLGFIILFLSVIFILPISPIKADFELELHDNIFVYDNNKDYPFKQAMENAITYLKQNNSGCIIYPSNIIYDNVEYDVVAMIVNDMKPYLTIRYSNQIKKQFILSSPRNVYLTGYLFSNSGDFKQFTVRNTDHVMSYPIETYDISVFKEDTTINYPIITNNTSLKFRAVHTWEEYTSFTFRGETYDVNNYYIDENFNLLPTNPHDNLKGIYNYSAKNIVDLDYVEYNFVVDLDSEKKFLFYLKDPITKIKTQDFESFDLFYRNLNADVNDPFIFIDTFSINDRYSFIKTRNINYDFIEFHFDGAEYREDLYFLNDILDQIEFKIKIIPKDNTKIQNLHLYDAYETYNNSLDYYLIPKSWKVNSKNYTFDYFTTGFIQGTVNELDNLKPINLPPGVNKIFLYSSTDTLSTVIGYDLTDKRRLYNYSLSEKKIISTVNNFEILDSFNTKWQNLYKIEKNIYNDEIFYLELLDFHSLGYTLWVSQEVEYSFFNDKIITIKDVPIDNVSNPDRQEIIDTDNNFSDFKKGFNAVNILYGTFYNNLTTEFKFLHNFLITLIILSVVLWVVML